MNPADSILSRLDSTPGEIKIAGQSYPISQYLVKHQEQMKALVAKRGFDPLAPLKGDFSGVPDDIKAEFTRRAYQDKEDPETCLERRVDLYQNSAEGRQKLAVLLLKECNSGFDERILTDYLRDLPVAALTIFWNGLFQEVGMRFKRDGDQEEAQENPTSPESAPPGE